MLAQLENDYVLKVSTYKWKIKCLLTAEENNLVYIQKWKSDHCVSVKISHCVFIKTLASNS